MVEVGELGYVSGYTLARENLLAGRTVVADSVNPVQAARDAWRAVGDDCKVAVIEIEVICSNPEEHHMRVEQRTTDIPGLVLPTWEAVRAREYHPWTRDRIVIDTSGRSPQESARDLAERVSSSKSMTGTSRAAIARSMPQA